MKIVKIFAALVGLTFVFIFCSSNDTKVTLSFLEYSTPETYLFLYVLSAFVLGMIGASFASTLKIMQLKRQINKLQPQDNAEVEKTAKGKEKKNKKKDDEKSEQQIVEEKKVEEVKPEVSPVMETSAADDNVSDAVFDDDKNDSETAAVIELPHEDVVDSNAVEKKE
ncbi:MAG: hypothetical protein B6I36_09210 [Desulfobacteraceae bacterium 4572_35.1]|nr:MAG: hypothetical protein B6I36_09210 [Desulfobacteraceae bacterium 4572_35.1]